jgi:TonB family protein
MRIEGPLAQRRLLTPAVLRGWPNADLLTNTVVNLVVNSEGLIEFAQLSPRGSGLEAADQSALQCAKSLRFSPMPRRGSEPPGNRRREVTVGTAVFTWQTLPLTSSTPANDEP